MTEKDKLFLKDILKPIRRMPPLQDTYSARHLPFGRLTAYGQRKKEEEEQQKHEKL